MVVPRHPLRAYGIKTAILTRTLIARYTPCERGLGRVRRNEHAARTRVGRFDPDLNDRSLPSHAYSMISIAVTKALSTCCGASFSTTRTISKNPKGFSIVVVTPSSVTFQIGLC